MKIVSMGDVQMLFPMEPKEFWQKLKVIVEQVVIEHSNTAPIVGPINMHGLRPLLKVNEVCDLLKITKPTLYDWMKKCRIESIKIQTRRYFKPDEVDKLIETSREKISEHPE